MIGLEADLKVQKNILQKNKDLVLLSLKLELKPLKVKQVGNFLPFEEFVQKQKPYFNK